MTRRPSPLLVGDQRRAELRAWLRTHLSPESYATLEQLCRVAAQFVEQPQAGFAEHDQRAYRVALDHFLAAGQTPDGFYLLGALHDWQQELRRKGQA